MARREHVTSRQRVAGGEDDDGPGGGGGEAVNTRRRRAMGVVVSRMRFHAAWEAACADWRAALRSGGGGRWELEFERRGGEGVLCDFAAIFALACLMPIRFVSWKVEQWSMEG